MDKIIKNSLLLLHKAVNFNKTKIKNLMNSNRLQIRNETILILKKKFLILNLKQQPFHEKYLKMKIKNILLKK